MEKMILVAEEVAQMLRVDKQRVYELVRTKRIPFVRIGSRQYRFAAQEIQRWLEQGGSKNENEESN